MDNVYMYINTQDTYAHMYVHTHVYAYIHMYLSCMYI